jgi:TonB family protein
MSNQILNFLLWNLLFAGFLGYYFLFLKRTYRLKLRRFFLLLAPISSLLIISINFSAAISANLSIPSFTLTTFEVDQKVSTQISSLGSFSIINVYMLISVILLSVYLIKVLNLFVRLRKEKYIKIKGLKVIEPGKYEASFSFFNYVVLGKNVSEKNRESILIHESGHVKNLHSIDILYYELVKAICWINPLVWLASRELKEVHELEADQGVVAQGVDKAGYMELILSQNFSGPVLGLANYFNQKLIKKRFVMMTKTEKPQKWSIRILMLLPLLFAMFYLVSCAKKEKAADEAAKIENQEAGQNASETNSETPDEQSEEKVFDAVEVMPEYPGGQEALFKYLQANITYPEKSKEEGIQGVVKVQFVVEEDGNCADFKVTGSVNDELDQEAMRVMQNMPAWKAGESNGKPVKVSITLPISFKLEEK